MKTLACACAVAAALLLPVSSQGKPLQYTLLHNFCTQGDCTDGNTPVSGLTLDADGNVFGTTETGGPHNNGTVFELEHRHKSYVFKVLHDFCFSCGDGDFPMGGLIVDVSGNIYGTATGGGAHDCGLVFQLSPVNGKYKYKVLHDFCAQDGDGDAPDQALSYAGKNAGRLYDGVSPLYGTTANGGVNGRGTVFSLTPKGKRWKLRIVYAFCAQSGCADGGTPTGEVLVDDNGSLFGNVNQGGAAGAVYEISSSGARVKERIIHTFCAPDDCSDGQGPIGALVKRSNGEILGTTEGALGVEGGAIFKLVPNGGAWDESLVHVFCAGDCSDGYLPSGGLTADAKENIYGVNELGGTGESGIGGGTAYVLKDSTLTPVYEFCSTQNCADGRVPMGGLISDGHGRLFGITSQGGPITAAGTVFVLAP